MSTPLIIEPIHTDPEKQGEVAARATPGPLLLLAGPGSGKTECLAMRLKWLIKEQSVASEAITVITFTNEATKNMKERISDSDKPNVYIEPESQPQITTMHSLATRILIEKLEALGLKEGFSVIVEEDERKLLSQDAASLAGRPRAEGLAVLSAKRAGELGSLSAGGLPVLEWYDKILHAMNSIDFDDQLILACRVLKENPDLLTKYRQRCVHLLVDEYQDINPYQDQLIKLLAQDSLAGLYVVGDDDQSIYSFRGGSPKYIRDFERAYAPGGHVIRLSVCRRCPSTIIEAALAVVAEHNKGRLPKPKFDFIASSPGRVVIHDVPSEAAEAWKIAELAAQVPVGSSTMILVPTAPFAKPIKRALERMGLGYNARTRVKLPGMRVSDRASSWLAEYKDDLATRILMDGMCNVAAFGVPSAKCKESQKVATREKMLGRVAGLWKRMIGRRLSLYKALEAECRAVEGKAQSKRGDDDELLLRIRVAFQRLKEEHAKPIEQFLQALTELLKPWTSPTALLDEVKDALDEAYVRRGSKSPGVINVLSMGLAKGLEADYVHVVGLDKDVFPNGKAAQAEVEEASRLLYVAMSRAKVELHLYHSRKRSGSITYQQESRQMQPSPFLDVIPKKLYEKDYTPAQTKNKRGQAP